MASGKVRVSPGVFIPEGVEDVEYFPSDYIDDDLGGFVDETIDVEVIVDDGYDESGTVDDAPAVPESFIIVSQTIRYNPDGSQVVDVVAETDDLPGADSVEVRVTKI